VGSNPSGTIATMMPMAKMKPSRKETPIRRLTAKKVGPTAAARTPIRLAQICHLLAQGKDRRSLGLGQVRDLAEFSSMPVAKTSVLASPDTIEVRAIKILWA